MPGMIDWNRLDALRTSIPMERHRDVPLEPIAAWLHTAETFNRDLRPEDFEAGDALQQHLLRRYLEAASDLRLFLFSELIHRSATLA